MSGGSQHTLSDDDGASETSTLVYGQEPYETYQHRVRALLRELYDDEAAHRAEIYHMAGGSSNRVVGVKLLPAQGDPVLLVLRTPRFVTGSEDDVAKTCAVLRALGPFLTVPTVVRFDTGTDNPLERSFLLMNRLPGLPFSQAVSQMTLDARCEIAVEFARLLHKILRMPVPAGVGPLLGSESGELWVGPYEDGHGPAPDTFRGLIASRLDDLRAANLRYWSDNVFCKRLCTRLEAAAHILLEDMSPISRNVLYHPDLAGRNILVDQSVDGHWHITGVLDWDDVAVVPYEIACMCPGWLWSREDEPERDEHEYYYDPDERVTDDNGVQIKHAFVNEIERMEPGFLDVVRGSRDRELRRLYRLACDGFTRARDTADMVRVEAAATAHNALDNCGCGSGGFKPPL